MNVIFESISKSFGNKIIFENLTGNISSGDRIGILGANGIGKTTLARILAGLESQDSGDLIFSPENIKVLYIEQYPEFDEKITVYDELYKHALRGSTPERADWITRECFKKVDLDRKLWNQRAMTLSGGEKTKLVLCRAMVCKYDILILDEPTNHLDMESCEKLEEFLAKLDKTLLVISHDRYFLDNIVTKIWEFSRTGIKTYEGNYSEYKYQKDIETKNQMKEYNKQQREIRHLKQMITERKSWYKSAHNAAGQNDFYRSKSKKQAGVIKAKQKQLERLEASKIERPQKELSPAFDIINKNIIGQKFPPVLVQVQDLSKRFGERQIFENVSTSIMRQDKVAILGKNGTGKTTFLRILRGLDKAYEGKVNINPSVKTGYFAQELDNLKEGNTVLDEALSVGGTQEEVRALLACLLFKGDDVFKKIELLSMGEKCRMAFAKLILSGANLLILDEPTNYMDILSREKIEQVLEDFQGSIIFVSHDRYLVSRIANKVLEIENLKLKYYNGGYEYYLEKKQKAQAKSKVSQNIEDEIRRLELELAYLGGRLDLTLDEEEKNYLNEKFLATARMLNEYKQML